MINISTEQVVSFTHATKHLPQRRAGKRPHVATLYRWSQRGCKGIHLETVQIGGTRCTSLEALQRFFDRLTNAGMGDVGDNSHSPKLPASPLRGGAVERELDRLGL